jgi:hypothetical protein
MHVAFLFVIALFNPLRVSSFLIPLLSSQFHRNDTISLIPTISTSENITFAESITSTNITPAMTEHDGFRTVAYFVNWVRTLLSYNVPQENDD